MWTTAVFSGASRSPNEASTADTSSRSGAHPDDRDPQLLDTTLGRLVSDQGWETELRVHGVFTRWAKEFLALAERSGVAVIDGTHYGTEKPPQLAMVDWFRNLGLDAEFIPDGPK